MKKVFKKNKLLFILLTILALGILTVFGIDLYVKISTKDHIVLVEDIKNKDAYEYALILGAGLQGNGPSKMLKERLEKGIELYEAGKIKKLIMSGDHMNADYDEVNVMKEYAIERGVKSSDIFMDHAGISTYDSVYRAKEIFGLDNVIIITQKYHLYRALYIAKSLDIEALGIDAKVKTYGGQFKREIREILARNKDFLKCIVKPTSFLMGESVSASGNGNITNDKLYISIKNSNEEIFITDEAKIEEIKKLIEKLDFKNDKKIEHEYTMEFNDGLYYFDITNGSVSLFTEDGKQSLLTQSEASKWIEILNLDE